MSEEMMKRIISYWTHRADSYSKLNREEFGWGMNDRWLAALESEFPDKPREEIRVLDIGTGPGFFFHPAFPGRLLSACGGLHRGNAEGSKEKCGDL